MKKYISFLLAGVLTASCIDTNVLPDGTTTGEDYWKTKEDVTAMVYGAYKGFANPSGVIERFIAWGELRSDNVNNASLNNTYETALSDINLGVMQSTNTYADWASIYSIINKCNIVLERSEAVMSLDPNYTQSTYQTDRSQMLALRSLCYFYLVRAFRDVPYVTAASFYSSQDFEVGQSAPLTVLDNCVADLQEALEHPVSSAGFSDWRGSGLFNKDAINALLADIYLWRASLTHSSSDYEKAVDYCDAVIESRKSQYPQESTRDGWLTLTETFADGSVQDAAYPLIPGYNAYEEIFCNGNSQETLFEIVMDGAVDYSKGVQNMYLNYNASKSNSGLLKASQYFYPTDGTGVFNYTYDYRYYESCFALNDKEATSFNIRKVGAQEPTTNGRNTATDKFTTTKSLEYTLGEPRGRWVVYRLTDVMLMKAEALVQLADDAASLDTDKNLQEAFLLTKLVNYRSLAESADKATVSLQTKDYTSKTELEELVLDERRRELCFEGKRWFDLMRYNNRHVSGELYPDKTMYEISSKVTDYPQNTDYLKNTVAQKYVEASGSAVMNKMGRVCHLYFPVLSDQVKINRNLHQNPAYSEDDIYTKN